MRPGAARHEGCCQRFTPVVLFSLRPARRALGSRGSEVPAPHTSVGAGTARRGAPARPLCGWALRGGRGQAVQLWCGVSIKASVLMM